ncbi:hypothetical protein BGW36DRAFT_360377 [Talaromyces proteolyticus]|uniref:Uncharacterized protein n=1 Tax=Talaromyces proteolyticus TaxID=1131652 RepID=A0AAD4Q053_9EURO|nr:uncharacterized protein BGW36DRAFT_360377 [Talaromyces proteolyticus]KAH8696548.1 hypothetical protein BGW36DRAFT_360377 [Talaromyces proteolyticus]
MANTGKCPGYEPQPEKDHKDDYNDPGKAEKAKGVINTAHILHFTFPELPDKGGFPTVLNLIGGIMPSPEGHDVLYAHGYVPKEILLRFGEPPVHHLKVTVTASKVYSYYFGYSPFSHGITFRSAVINGSATLLRYSPDTPQCKAEISDKEITSKDELPWALFNIVEGMFGSEHRWNDTRHPFKDEELKRVPVLRVEIDKSASRLHERLGVLGYEPDWETSSGEKYWEGSIPIWETYGDHIQGNTKRDFPEYLSKVFIDRKKHNEEVAVEEAKRKSKVQG